MLGDRHHPVGEPAAQRFRDPVPHPAVGVDVVEVRRPLRGVDRPGTTGRQHRELPERRREMPVQMDQVRPLPANDARKLRQVTQERALGRQRQRTHSHAEPGHSGRQLPFPAGDDRHVESVAVEPRAEQVDHRRPAAECRRVDHVEEANRIRRHGGPLRKRPLSPPPSWPRRSPCVA